MFKPDPKKQVVLKFAELFGTDYKPTVTGRRLTPAECKEQSYRCTTRDGLYLTELAVGGETLAIAVDRDWRKSYKALKLEVEKLFADGVSLV